MTTYRLMDGVDGRPGVGSSQTTPPADVNDYQGPFQAGIVFAVTQPAMWFEGFWWWVPSNGDTSPQGFALWSIWIDDGGAESAESTLVASVTSGTLTAGEFNYIPLSSPLPITIGVAQGTYLGGAYVATTAWTASAGFPDTGSQFGSGDTYADGITNGPLVTYGVTNCPSGIGPSGGSVYSTGGDDPFTADPPLGSDANNDLFWLDVQVSDTGPEGYTGPYSLWPNRWGTNAVTTGDAEVNYVVSTEFHLSQACTAGVIRYYSPVGTDQLATRASVYSITGADAGTEVIAVTSPSWSAAAGSGWVECDTGSDAVLQPGAYKVAIYNDAESPDFWSPKDENTDYWGETLTTGEGVNGISWGPLSAPNYANSSACYLYDDEGGDNTPPWTDGTGDTTIGQPTFAISGPQYPYLYSVVNTDESQNYWVDVQVTPQVVTEVTQPPFAYVMRRV